MSNIELLGSLAGLASTLSFLPQAFKVWQTGRTKDISTGMYVLYFLSLILWSLYGWFIGSYSLLITELITSVFVLYILVKMLKNSDRR